MQARDETQRTETRGRPRGSTGGDRALLNPLERRVAFMYVAGVSTPAAAIALETYAENISNILQRPHVERFIRRISAETALEARDSADALNATIERATSRAFHVENQVMENLFALEPAKEADYIKSQLGAACTAQDILDRAGKRAPSRAVVANTHSLDPSQLDHLISVMEEVGLGGEGTRSKVIDITRDAVTSAREA